MLYYTRGLPGSGKTTTVKKMALEHDNPLLTSLDDLREELFDAKKADGIRLTYQQENQVKDTQLRRVRKSLTIGRTVFVHDTNLSEKRAHMWQDLATEFGTAYEVIDLRSVPAATCIERDARRDETVGSDVINMMAERFTN